jgi:hypothetical protein
MRCPECGGEFANAEFHSRTHEAATEWLDKLDGRVSAQSAGAARGRAGDFQSERSA